ncbi:ejaculatory bulb-specific protein 3-like [Pieris rapae]|uniref:ejaculatory bulb-specific protein 3-like n=1 Tax=Pieris rapae TaxID=64459 RepID=UPI001E27D459|nr:ejaculatory bulb-specific protein 3-like [Pieris rapae]
MFLFIISFLILSQGIFGYDEKYNNVDVDKIISDDTLLLAYINCFLDKGPCDTEFAQDYRDMLPEVIATACGKCSDIQRKNVRKLITIIFEKKTALAAELQAKYDPESKFQDKIAALMKDD